jgi:PIN domain nuclease of toxin-antitoxin system
MILLDTHVLIWMAAEPAKLTKRARTMIQEAMAGGGVAVAAITLWELAWIAEQRRIQFTGTVDRFVKEITGRVAVLPITPEIAATAAHFPDSYPKDPQDRLIGATALVHGIPLITADDRLRASKAVTTVW